MTNFKYQLALLILCSAYSAYGQINCSKDKLVGLWRQAESIPGIHTNVDSLKSLIAKSSKTIGTLDLKADGTYKYTFLDNINKKYGPYALDTLTCEVILGSKRKRQKKSNLEIIYLDNQFFIFSEDNNPKGDVTHLNGKIDGTQ